MAVNKVQRADGTVEMDISDTTATESDVAAGEVFYKANGTRSIGTGTKEIAHLYTNGSHQSTYSDVKSAIEQNKLIIVDNLCIITNATYDTTDEDPINLYGFSGVADNQTYCILYIIDSATSTWESVEYPLALQDDIPTAATDNVYGLIKLNTTQNIYLDENGNLIVGGRLGQTVDLGLYNPVFADPVQVGRFSLLMSEAKGLSAAHRELIIAGGAGLSLKTAAQAGATEYRVSNTQQNRFVAACFVGTGSVLTIDEAYAKEKTVPIVSCKFANGSDVTAYFGATESNNDIIITTSESINPDNSITNIRCYGSWTNADIISAGQGNRTGGGKALQVGASLFTGANNNQVLQLGNRQYSTKNNVIMIGNDLISKKQFWALFGQGHENTDAKDGGIACGLWSEITPNTKLAVGNGTAYNNRSNIFEVRDNLGVTEVIMKSPNGTKFKVTVDDSGNLSTTPV